MPAAIALALVATPLDTRAAGANAAATTASDDQAPASPADAARTHYARGLELLTAGDPAAAAEAFRRAYELEPKREVLYTLGLVYVRLEQPVEAIAALERYLADTTTPSVADHERLAKEQIAQQEPRVAFLSASLEPAAARLTLDGQAPRLGADGRIRLDPGEHALKAELEGYEPHQESFRVASGETHALRVALTSSVRAPLTLSCALPDVAVLVDGQYRATTPLSGPLELPLGRRSLRLTRPGYTPAEAQVELTHGKPSFLKCQLGIVRSPNDARLELKVSEPHARVLLDGAPPPADGRLPAGRHRLEVLHEGFFPFQQDLLLRPSEVRNQNAVLSPTPDYLKRYRERATSRRRWAYVVSGAGLALGAGAAGVGMWNAGRYDDYQTQHSLLQNAGLDGNPLPDDYGARIDENNAALASVQSADKVTWGLGLAASAALVTGVVMYFLGGDPGRYDKLPPTSTATSH